MFDFSVAFGYTIVIVLVILLSFIENACKFVEERISNKRHR